MSSREQLRYEVARLKRRGRSNRSIAKVLGIDRRTVRKLLAEVDRHREQGGEEDRRYATRASKLDPFRSVVVELMRQYPDIKAMRVYEELEARGFEGGYTIVRECVRQLRPKPVMQRAKRVETARGHQAQADFSPYELDSGLALNAFSVVLSHSRYLYADFTADQRQPTIFRQLVAAFEAFGGTPEEIVFDSMSGIVDRWELDGPILNLRALDFAAHYDFAYHIAPRGDGAYKGKIERPYLFLETSFFNGRTLHSFEHARGALRVWLDDRANARRHGQTKRVPAEELVRERPLLTPLPARPYDTREAGYRIVDGYGRVHFDGNTYSTPLSLSGRRVVVRAGAARVELYERFGTKLCEHARQPRGAGRDVTADAHRKRTHAVSHDQLLLIFKEWGPAAETFARALVERQRYRRKQLSAILAMQDRVSVGDIVAALEHADRYRAYDARDVERILEAKARPRQFADRMAAAVKRQVRKTLGQTPVSKREPAEYARVVGSTSPTGEETDDDNEDTPEHG